MTEQTIETTVVNATASMACGSFFTDAGSYSFSQRIYIDVVPFRFNDNIITNVVIYFTQMGTLSASSFLVEDNTLIYEEKNNFHPNNLKTGFGFDEWVNALKHGNKTLLVKPSGRLGLEFQI